MEITPCLVSSRLATRKEKTLSAYRTEASEGNIFGVFRMLLSSADSGATLGSLQNNSFMTQEFIKAKYIWMFMVII